MGEYLQRNMFDNWARQKKIKVTNLKASTLTRPVSTDPHSISQRSSGLLNNTWAGAAPWAVTHVNRHYVIILTDGDSTVTYNTPTRPETSMNLKRKWVGNTFFIHNTRYLRTHSSPKCLIPDTRWRRGAGGGGLVGGAKRRMEKRLGGWPYHHKRVWPGWADHPRSRANFLLHNLPSSVSKCIKTLLA